MNIFSQCFNPYFIGLPILITRNCVQPKSESSSFNPYFIGLPILIMGSRPLPTGITGFQSLFYWITYSYTYIVHLAPAEKLPVFQSLFYWITYSYVNDFFYLSFSNDSGFNPYFIGLPILILVKIMNGNFEGRFNPYFIGLPILIGHFRKIQ